MPESASPTLTMPPTPPPGLTAADPLRVALLDSRQRWRDLVTVSADFAYETDAWGRLIFVIPDPVLGWPAGSLVGQPAERLLADGGGFDPFRVTAPVRHRRVWLRRGDGGVACLTIAAMPIADASGAIVGVRGLGIDMTEADAQGARMAAALRRGEVLEHILRRTSHEVLAPRMMRAALESLMDAVGAEGSAVVLDVGDSGMSRVAHDVGQGAERMRATLAAMLPVSPGALSQTVGIDGRAVLMAGCETRFGAYGGIAVWRSGDNRSWDQDDRMLLLTSANVIRMVLEHEAIQREMHRQARTDPLTSLLNRRAFMEELERHVDRLDRDGDPGTLMFADLDHFKAVNDALGHEAGDRVLITTADLLRRVVRPTDLVARLGGDEFAVWMNGVDHMTAAERADVLRDVLPREIADLLGPDAPRVGMSIGIACRRGGGHESLDSVIRRADMAMYEVKRHGRGHWRVSLEDPT
jgi:diguanylate cyclase (GGDEF)-like protein